MILMKTIKYENLILCYGSLSEYSVMLAKGVIGIYFLFNPIDNILYVGRSIQCLYRRIDDHYKTFTNVFSKHTVDCINLLYIPYYDKTDSEILVIEGKLINLAYENTQTECSNRTPPRKFDRVEKEYHQMFKLIINILSTFNID